MADAKYAIWTEGDVEEGGLRQTCEQYGDAMKLADTYARRHPGQSFFVVALTTMVQVPIAPVVTKLDLPQTPRSK